MSSSTNADTRIILTNDKQADLLSLVECPVCTHVPPPPIHACVNGHHLCYECRGKLAKCPQCQCPFLGSRVLRFAEHVIALLRIKCEHPGCDVQVPGDLHRDHIENCDYRPVQCELRGEEAIKGCDTVLINFQDYETHLIEGHKIFGYPREEPCYEYFHTFLRDATKTHNTFYMNYDGKFFILRVTEVRNVIYSWISLVEAEISKEPKYQATITYYNKETKRARCVFQMFVHHFRKSFESILETADIGGITKELLMPSCIKTTSSANQILGKRRNVGHYEWRSTVRIRKLDKQDFCES